MKKTCSDCGGPVTDGFTCPFGCDKWRKIEADRIAEVFQLLVDSFGVADGVADIKETPGATLLNAVPARELLDFASRWNSLGSSVTDQILHLLADPSYEVNPKAISFAAESLQGFNAELDNLFRRFDAMERFSNAAAR